MMRPLEKVHDQMKLTHLKTFARRTLTIIATWFSNSPFWMAICLNCILWRTNLLVKETTCKNVLLSYLQQWKALNCKPSANCACMCAIPLIEGLWTVYRGLPLASSRRVWHGQATVVESMRKSIHAFGWDFLSLQGTQSKHILSNKACANVHAITFEQCFYENRQF